MPFSNPIVAEEELIRNAIKSENYVAGESGWRIARNGDAEFSNAVIRGITQGETGSFNNVSAQTSFTYRGDELQTLLENLPQGLLGWVYGDVPSPPGYWETGTELIIANINAPIKAGRMYNIKTNTLHSYVTGASGRTDFNIRYTTNGTAPTTSSPLLGYVVSDFSNGFFYIKAMCDFLFTTSSDVTIRIALTMQDISGTGVSRLEDEGSVPQLLLYDVGRDIPETPPSKVLKEFDIACTASQSYWQNGTIQNSGDKMHHGYSVTAVSRGYQWSKCQFHLPTVDDLTSVPIADIVQLEVFIYWEYWHNAEGGLAHIGVDTDGGPTKDLFTVQFEGRNAGKWVNILDQAGFTARLFDGTFQGIVLGSSVNSTDPNTYGFAHGKDMTYPVRLRAKYYK